MKLLKQLFVVFAAAAVGGTVVLLALRLRSSGKKAPAPNAATVAIQPTGPGPVAPATTAAPSTAAPASPAPRSLMIPSPPPGPGGGSVPATPPATATTPATSSADAGTRQPTPLEIAFGAPVPAEANAATTSPGGKGMAGETTVNVVRDPATMRRGTSPYHQVHVLSIGVDIELRGVGGKLQFAANDATAIGNVFQKRYGFERVTILRGSEATRDRIYNVIEEIRANLARSNGQDDFILFFSGHGFTKSVPTTVSGKSTIARHGFLVPFDKGLTGDLPLDDWRRRGVEMKELTQRVIDLPARHRLMFIDSCFSGLAFAEQAVIRRPADEAYRDVIQKPTVQVMTAGLESESALEDPTRQHGIFTYALLQQIENSGVRTTEEIFFPLRATVRDELGRFPSGSSMTPQHRYLKVAEGTFVFVPTDWNDRWMDQRPDDAQYVQAGQKGYFEPVKPAEVEQVNNAATTGNGGTLARDPEWQQRRERYEARAAMGDPYAMTALARMFESGVGTVPDRGRARVWAQEGREVFNYSAAFGISDPKTARMVDDILNNDKLLAAVVGTENVEKTRTDLKKALELFQKLKKLFGGDGGKATVDAIEKQRVAIIRDLQESGRNRSARDRLNKMETGFRELAAAYSTDAKPEQFDEAAALLTRARERIEFGVQQPAISALEDVGQLLVKIKAQAPDPNATPPS